MADATTQTTSDLEKKVVHHLAQAWDAFLKLDDKHPDDLAEFRHSINALQTMVAWRVAKRVDPETWGA